jgi:hypothetical protein
MFCFVALFLCDSSLSLSYGGEHHSRIKKIARAAFPLRFRHRPPLLLLCSRRCHGLIFNFFKSSPSVAMSGAFQWHQLS